MQFKSEDIFISELDRLWGKTEPWIVIHQKSRNENIVLSPMQVDFLNQTLQKIIASSDEAANEEVTCLLSSTNWPPLDRPSDKYRDTEALSFLIASEFVIPNHVSNEGVVGLYIQCSGVFRHGPDFEPMPAISFSDEGDDPFWEFYHLCQKYNFDGLVKWCSLKRNKLPLDYYKHMLKKNAWCDRLQKIEDLENQKD